MDYINIDLVKMGRGESKFLNRLIWLKVNAPQHAGRLHNRYLSINSMGSVDPAPYSCILFELFSE